MKGFLAAALICAVFFSCKTPPSRGRGESLPPAVAESADAPAAEEEGVPPDAGEPALNEETPSVEDFAETPAEEPVELPVPDPPPPEVPRVITFLDPPPEEAADQDYPEPELPGLPAPPELSQAPEPEQSVPSELLPPGPQSEPAPSEPPSALAEKPAEDPALVSGAAPPPESAPLPETSPPPPSVPPPPPAPPPLVQPAESAGVRPPPREALPVPVTPVPGPPSQPPPAVPKRAGPAINPVPASPETEDAMSYSRTIRGTAGQILEVPFRGTGWVYLGETNAGQGISYLSRRTETEGQTFMFRLDERGEYELRFYKQDFIRDYILNDHVRVIVENAPKQDSFFYPEEPSRLVAEPRWPPPEKQAERTNSDEASPPAGARDGQLPETAAAMPGNVAPETAAGRQDNAAPEAAELLPAALLGRAREAYEAGQFPEALAALDEFRSNFPLGSDEAWWLYGQVLESSGPRRDIRGALEYYRRLVREYPQSPRCNDAGKRIAYLERFYFNIR